MTQLPNFLAWKQTMISTQPCGASKITCKYTSDVEGYSRRHSIDKEGTNQDSEGKQKISKSPPGVLLSTLVYSPLYLLANIGKGRRRLVLA